MKLSEVPPNTKILDLDNLNNNIDSFAKVIEGSSKDGSTIRTVIIKNTPEAYKVFGVKNIPSSIFKNDNIARQEVEQNTIVDLKSDLIPLENNYQQIFQEKQHTNIDSVSILDGSFFERNVGNDDLGKINQNNFIMANEEINQSNSFKEIDNKVKLSFAPTPSVLTEEDISEIFKTNSGGLDGFRK